MKYLEAFLHYYPTPNLVFKISEIVIMNCQNKVTRWMQEFVAWSSGFYHQLNSSNTFCMFFLYCIVFVLFIWKLVVETCREQRENQSPKPWILHTTLTFQVTLLIIPHVGGCSPWIHEWNEYTVSNEPCNISVFSLTTKRHQWFPVGHSTVLHTDTFSADSHYKHRSFKYYTVDFKFRILPWTWKSITRGQAS